MNLRKISILAVVTLALFIVANQFSKPKSDKNLSPIRIAIPKLYSSALLILAKERGIFKKNGLVVTLDHFKYGKECLKEMLKKKYDFSQAYITPIAKKIQDGEEFLVLTELHNSTENTFLIYRKDLSKKSGAEPVLSQIGLVKGTSAEFVLSLFAGTKTSDYKVSSTLYTQTDQLETDLISGKLQAGIFWQPQASMILTKHPDLLGRINMPFYTDISLLVGNNKFINTHKTETSLLIKSIVEAKSFFDSSPEKADEIILSYIAEGDNSFNKNAFKGINLDIRLSQIMVVMLESEIRWLSRSKLKFIKQLNKEEYIRKEYLTKYLPSKVTYQ
jgi:ABC-type nitrate/sulfonate/bicarbonate transport system substrate-binding protein